MYNFTCRASQQTFNVRESIPKLYRENLNFVTIYRIKIAYDMVFRRCNLLISLPSVMPALLPSRCFAKAGWRKIDRSFRLLAIISMYFQCSIACFNGWVVNMLLC